MKSDKKENKLNIFEGLDRENKLTYEEARGEGMGNRIARKKSTRPQRVKSKISKDVK